MKKIVCISLCVLLCVPLLALSAFAEDSSFSVSLTIHNSVNQGVSFKVDGESFALNYNASRTFEFGVGSHVIQFLGSQVLSGDFDLSTDSSNPSIVSDNLYFDIISLYGGATYYFEVSPPPPPDPLSPVNDGVSAFIGFGGDVLHFISNNSSLLFLIGLSVGLCLVIPFGVSKIKDLLKGY